MATRSLRCLSWAAVALPLVLLLCHEWFGPDIWYHLYLGGRVAETLTAQPSDRLLLQQPDFINFYWLFQLGVRGVYALGGLWPVSLLFLTLWGGVAAVWLGTTGALRAGAVGPWVALLAILVCQIRFEARPEIVSYLFLALQIRWLVAWKMEQAPAVGTLLGFAAVEAIWANVHGYFVFGPLLVGLKLAAAALSGEAPPGPRRLPGWVGLWQLLGLSLLASVASPFGLRNWEEVAVLWHFFGAMHHQIQEFLRPGERPQIDLWTIRLFWAYWLVLLAGGIGIARVAGHRQLFVLLLAAVGLGLSAQAVRNIPLAVVFGAPLLGVLLTRLPPERAAGPLRLAVVLAGAALSAWIVGGGFYSFVKEPGRFGIRESTLAYPVGFAGYVRDTGFGGTIFSNGTDGGYLEFHCPTVRPYGDSRYVDAPLVDEYFRAVRRSADFRQLEPQLNFDGVLLPVVDGLDVIVALLRDPQWRLAYADSGRAFLANRQRAAGAAAAIREPQFYQGADLTVPRQAVAAISWIHILALTNDRGNLLRALGQLSAAPRIPSEILQEALTYGQRNGDQEIIAAARALRPRMLALQAIDQETVDWQLRRALP